jgi:predicted  nucleic acid-binding Zn-ribbon protein
VGVKLGDIDNKLASIPDFDSITNMLKDFDRRLKDLEKRTSKNESSIVDHSNTLLKSVEDIQALYLKDSDLESRITAAEEEIELLKNRPIGGGDVDLSGLATSQSLFDLLDRVKLVEKRNIEQDDRLTNNELRIEKLEKLISDPMERIMALERRCDNIQVDLNNKVSVSDLYNELLKKADINGLKALEASLLRLNDLINDLMN